MTRVRAPLCDDQDALVGLHYHRSLQEAFGPYCSAAQLEPIPDDGGPPRWLVRLCVAAAVVLGLALLAAVL